MSVPGKKIALLSGTAALVIVLVVGLALKDWLREEWYIAKLRTAERDELIHAVRELGEMRCVRSVPAILEASKKELGFIEHQSFIHALQAIGPRCIPVLLEALVEEDQGLAREVLHSFSAMDEELMFDVDGGGINFGTVASGEAIVESIASDDSFNPTIREAASRALEKLRQRRHSGSD